MGHTASGRRAAMVSLVGLALACGSASSESGRCGDGVVQHHEGCDDGNAVDGDGCNRDCKRSGQRQWCYKAEVAAGHSVSPVATLAVESGVVVAGRRSSDEGEQPWLLALSPSGRVAWEQDRLLPSPSRLQLRALARDPAANTVLAAGVLVAGNGGPAQAWFGEFELEHGELIRQRRHGDPGTSLRPSAIAVSDAGLWLAGAAGADAWLARFDASWELAWEQRFDYDAGLDRGYRVITLPGDRVAVAGNATRSDLDGVDERPGTFVFVRVYDSSGALELDVAPAGQPAPEHRLVDAVAWTDGVLVGGSRGEVFPPSLLWSIAGDGQLADAWAQPDPTRFVSALARGSSAVFVAGSRREPVGPVGRWLGRLDPDLHGYAWERIGPPGEFVALTAALAEPALYAAALIPREHGGTDTTICKFSE